MKRAFVIYEGVLHSARTGEDDKGQRDWAAAQFLTAFRNNGHLMILSDAILVRYRRKLAVWETSPVVTGLNVNKLMGEILFVSPQYTKVDVSSVHLPKGKIPEDDEDFVKAAVARPGSILVTCDQPLLHRIAASGLLTQGLRAMHVKESLTIVSKPDP